MTLAPWARIGGRTLLLSLAFLLGALPLAHADEDPAAEGAGEELVTRLFPVASLTQGRPFFLRSAPPLGIDGLGDEEQPLFGAEAEERLFHHGSIDHLVELIQHNVEPEHWESTYGAAIVPGYEHTLVVRTFPDVADKVAAFLARIESRHVRSVSLELAAVPGDVVQGAPRRTDRTVPDATMATWLQGGHAHAMGVAAFERHQFSLHLGGQYSYVSDYDVEVAKQAYISDPIIMVDNLGLAAQASVVLSPSGQSAVVEVGGHMVRMRSTREVVSGKEDDRTIEVPDMDVARLATQTEMGLDAWTRLDGQAGSSGGWSFFARVRVLENAPRTDRVRSVELQAPTVRPSRTLESAGFDIGVLAMRVMDTQGRQINLTPSNFTPPEPPELDEPMPVFGADVLAELMQQTVAPASWEGKGVSISGHNDVLSVRNAPYVVKAIRHNLEAIRKGYLGTLSTRSAWVRAPRDAWSGPLPAVGSHLSPEALETLRAQEGVQVAEASVSGLDGVRGVSQPGREINYLADYEVELAEGATVSNPVIQRIVSGVAMDCEATRMAGGQAAQTILRFAHGALETPMRRLRTPHGLVDLPALSIYRVHVATPAPLGKTLVAAVGQRAGQVELLLVTTTWEPTR